MPTLEQQVVAAYRKRSGRLVDRATLDLLRAWGLLDAARLDATFPAWVDAVTAVFSSRGQESRLLAQEFYDVLRIAGGVGGPKVISTPGPIPVSTFQADMKIKVLIGVKDAMSAGRTVAEAMNAAFVNSTGRATKSVLDLGREEIIALGNTDAAVTRFSRVTSGGCKFCRMLAGRGAVYYESTADFASHDHCKCSVVPNFGDETRGVRDYQRSTRTRTQADRDALRAYLAAN